MRRRYFSGAYGQGAGDRGGDPHASRSENIAAGRTDSGNVQRAQNYVAPTITLPKDKVHIPDVHDFTITPAATTSYINKKPSDKKRIKKTIDEDEGGIGKALINSIYNRSMIIPGQKKRSLGYATDYLDYYKDKGGNIEGLEDILTMDKKDWSAEEFDKVMSLSSQPPGYRGQEGIIDYPDYLAEYKGAPGTKYSGNVGGLNKYVKTRNPDGSPATYGYTRETGGEGPEYYPGYVPGGSPVSGGGAGDDDTDDTDDLGGGHFKVPDEYILAEGGRAGYQEGNMVGAEMEGAEMEGAEMEGAMMESKEIISRLYEAFMAQGLSPEEAMKKIREIIAAAQDEEPEAPMMGEEFPGQEFHGGPRAPAAFGGIMDTYTGRRKYGLGSFFKKAVKKVKKLASSKFGKMALGYLATAGMANIMAPGAAQWGSPLGKGSGWLRPEQLLRNLGLGASTVSAGSGTDVIHNKGLLSKALNFAKSPTGLIVGGGALTGYLADKPPIDKLDDVQGEWDEDKEAFDKYLASLDTGDSYRVPSQYTLAEGGRIGRQEGGLMNLGGMEKDYRNDGGFVPLGGEEKADDVPARLSRNEFVFTADAVRNAGEGDIDKGAEVMENVMNNLEAGGKVSEESQGQGQGAQDMFQVSERLSEVV